MRLSTITLACLFAASTALISPAARAQAASAEPPAAPASAPRAGLRIDDRRPENPLTVDLLGKPVEITGSWEYNDERRRNFDLNRARARDRRVRDHEVKLEARARPTPDTEVFIEAVGLQDTRRTQGTRGADRNHSFERGQSWVKVERLGGSRWAVQAGRVALIDRRSWWWDDDLDAVRLIGGGEGWRLETGLGRELARVSSEDRRIRPENRGVMRWFGQATWDLARRHRLDAFWLIAHDRSRRPRPGSSVANEDATDPSDLRGRWVGLRASGEWRPETGPRLVYWVDTALMRGREGVTDYDEADDGRFIAGDTRSRRVRGHAFDLGATAIFPVWLRPSLTAGFARGSGGTRNGSRDANFRQTGLQENKARFAGVKRVQTYGELLQPELSNLEVSTLGAGIRVLENSSIELIGHRYHQPVASTVLPGARIGADPAGRSGDIGHEIDLVMAMREWRQLELTLKWSRFKPGSAFAEGERDPARAIELGVAINF